MYSILKETVKGKPTFIPYNSKINITNKDLDYYLSLFQYTNNHKEEFSKKGSVAGLKDTTTETLYFDFDKKDNVDLAKADAIDLAKTLVERYNIDPDNIKAYFSGYKGFGIEIKLDKRITNQQFKAAVGRLAGHYKTFDHVVSDANRIIRITNTKHPISGLYKIPLHLYELDELSVNEIKELAKTTREEDFITNPVSLPNNLFYIKEESSNKTETTNDIKEALSTKPPHWKNYKWALAQGFFDSGERHNALMVVAATCRGLGYDKQTAYYICKSALKKQAARTNSPEFDKSELFENIIEQSVYSDTWEGGQYSPKTNPWLAEYCKRMGFDANQKEELEVPAINLTDMSTDFVKFAQEFDKNILKTGIKELDDNATLTVSTLNGLLGQPGAGKTSMAINYLRNTSRAGINSMFFSLDMGKQIVYSKLLQKETGLDFKQTLDLYRTNPAKALQVEQKLKEDYKHVGFNFRAGTTVADIRRSIKEQEQLIGNKVKLVIIDYLECIQSSLSDPTAGAGQIAGQLKDVANEEEVCILLLLQTQKHSTPEISDPLLSLKQVKGSSVVEQSCSTILTLWREGYSPKYVDDDRYISFAVVKNRFGGLWSGDFSWKGLTGDIRSLTEEEQQELKEFKKRKREEKAAAEALNNKAWE